MADEIAVFDEATAIDVLQTIAALKASGLLTPKTVEGGKGYGESNSITSLAPIFVYNDSAEIVPAYSFMQATTTLNEDGRNYIKIKKPIDSTILRCPLLINGSSEIPIGGYGMAQNGPVYRLKCDTIPELGDRMGPKTGEWLGHLGSMYAVIGADEVDEDVFKVMFDTSSWRGRTKTGGLLVGVPALVSVYSAAGSLRTTEYIAETAVSSIPENAEILLLSQYGRWLAMRIC